MERMGPLVNGGGGNNSQPFCIMLISQGIHKGNIKRMNKHLETNRSLSLSFFLCLCLSLSLEYCVANAFSVAQKSLQVGHYFQHYRLDGCNMLDLEFPWKTSQKPRIMQSAAVRDR